METNICFTQLYLFHKFVYITDHIVYHVIWKNNVYWQTNTKENTNAENLKIKGWLVPQVKNDLNSEFNPL